METLLQDLRYAIRTLKRTPGFTLAAILTLALGIGANTAIFSVVDGVLLRQTPFTDVDRLAMIWETDRASGTSREPASIPDFIDFQQRSRHFSSMAGFIPAEANVNPDEGEPFRVAGLAVSHTFLPLTGLQPLVGRNFTPEEDAAGAPRVTIIGEELWTRLYARDPAAVGRQLRLNDVPHTIIGVMPANADFGALQILSAAAYGRSFADRGDRTRVDAWVALRPSPQASRGNHPLFVIGRLEPFSTIALAHEEMVRVAADLEREYPDANDERGANVEAISHVVFGPVRPALYVLLAAVVLVLLVACVNVANLLLVRGAARAQEITVRAALGAGAGRLARQFLAESAVLTGAGAALGIALAYLGLDALMALAPASIPRVDAVAVDGRVLAVSLGMAVLVGAVFSLVPMMQVRRRGADAVRSDAGRGSADLAQQRFRSGLVVSELAMAVVLLAASGLLIKSLWRLQHVDPGFRAGGVLKSEFQLPGSRYPVDFQNSVWPDVTRFVTEVRTRASQLPGVTDVSFASSHPLDAGFTSSIVVPGREAEAHDWPEPAIRRVDDAYFRALEVPLVEGRVFAPTDDVAAPTVIVINESARDRYFAGHNAVGQGIRIWGAVRTVVGVVGNERFRGLSEPTPPALYMPSAQVAVTSGSIMVRTSGDPARLAPALRRIVREIDPALPLFGVEPLSNTLSDTMGQRRFTMLVLGSFAGVALLLSIIGVHGVLSYTVSQRRREIGIRVALGADRRMVRDLVVGQGARMTALGLALGLAGALAATRLLSALLFGVGAADPLTYLAVVVLLGTLALLASWLPARRAARVDPMVVLRND